MLTLAFDTSSKTCSVAVLEERIVLYEVMIKTKNNHSETLLPAIEQACGCTGVRIGDFDLFACTLGPGSFTGLRVGVATLKGLVLAAQKPAAGVSSLAALAVNASGNSKFICALMDAGRGRLYGASFRPLKNGRLKRVTPEEVIRPQDVVKYARLETTFVGEGAVLYAKLLNRAKNKKCMVAPETHQFIRASSVGILGVEKYLANDLLNVEKCAPVYLRSEETAIGGKMP